MEKRIIFKNEVGGVSVVIPPVGAQNVEAIAAKDVPTGSPYKIVDLSEVPTDRTMRDQWTVDIADLTDGVGG